MFSVNFQLTLFYFSRSFTVKFTPFSVIIVSYSFLTIVTAPSGLETRLRIKEPVLETYEKLFFVLFWIFFPLLMSDFKGKSKPIYLQICEAKLSQKRTIYGHTHHRGLLFSMRTV